MGGFYHDLASEIWVVMIVFVLPALLSLHGGARLYHYCCSLTTLICHELEGKILYD